MPDMNIITEIKDLKARVQALEQMIPGYVVSKGGVD